MPRSTPQLRPAKLVFALLLSCFFGSALVSQTAPSTSAVPKEEVVALTPFEVNSTKDVGYLAKDTLAGSRLNTSLKDVAAQVSIMTPEFLRDVGAVTLDDALRYSLNIENTKEYYDAVSNNNATFTNNPASGNNRVRGLAQSTPTHDFFPTVIPIDAYNSDRFTFVYGPNAILFGSGNPSGSTDTSLKRARTGKAAYEVEFRADSNDTWRTSFDVNQPLYKKYAALRIAGVKMDNREAREPNFDRQERIYATLQIEPVKWAKGRLWVEDFHRDRMPVRNTIVTDAITPWIKAGRPIFDNGLGQALPANVNTPGAAGYNPAFQPYMDAARPVVLLGNIAGTSPAGIQYSGTTVMTRSYDTAAPSPDNFDYSLADGSIYPLSVNITGQALQNRQHGDIRGFSVELNPFRNFYLELGNNQERFIQKYTDLLPFGTTELRADANKFLPDRVTPNPNVGRYYLTSGPDTGIAYYSYRSRRVSGSYELNFTEKSSWQKWLGRHRFAALWTADDYIEGRQRSDFRLINNPASLSGLLPRDAAGNLLSPADSLNANQRDIRFRLYVDNPADAASKGNYSATLPFNPFSPGVLPGTDWQVATLDNPLGVRDPQTNLRRYLHSRVQTVQSNLLKDRLIVTYGRRHDGSKAYSIPTGKQLRTGTNGSTGIGGNAGYAWWYDQYDGSKQVANAFTLDQVRSGDTRLVNVVAHVHRWVSLFYDESNTQDPPASVKLNLDGSSTQVGDGIGKNYGISIRLLSDNLALRINKFETVQAQGISQYRAFTGIGGINPFRDAIHNIERSVMAAGAPASTKFASYSNAMKSLGANTGGNTFRETYDVVSDTVARGTEIELIANPTPNWRVSAGFARTDPSESGIATTWFAFIADRLPVWAQYKTAPTYTGVAIGGALDVNAMVVGNAINSWNFIQSAEGRRVAQQRRDRFNATSRYGFTQGPLKGFFAGGSVVVRSATTLGYGSRVAKGSELSYTQGFVAPTDTLVINDISQPIQGPALRQIDGFFGYSRRILRNKVTWRTQLNIRNVFDDQDRIPQRATSTGAIAVFTIPDPRTFILTNTFSF